MFDKISSGKIYGSTGNTFAAIEIDGNGVVIRNAADETDSSGNLVTAGSDEVLSANRATGTTINASYIKTGVLDANLMRAGLIQTVPSWNTKWYGAPEDHAAVQMGFTGGSIAATAVSTGTGTVSLTLPGGHGLVTSDYIRVSGLYFTTGTLLGGVGLNLPTNGPLDYASATVATNTLTYSKADITSGLTASTASTVYVGKAHTITAVVRSFDDPENPAELSTVVVTTGAAHGFSVGEYVELVNVAATIDGVAYITAVTSTTFTFKQRFGSDVDLDLSASDLALPSLLAPVAIKVLKSYTQNADGSIHITSGTVDSTLIVGEISATEITIGSGESVVRVGNYPDAISPTFQGIWAGSANPSTAEFSVNTAGALAATSGVIGGWTLGSTSLTAGSGATTVGLDSGGTNPSLYAGSATPSSAPFRVTNAGVLTATSGAVGGWTLGSTTLTGTNVTLSNTGVVTAGTGNNVAVMSAADATYRMWVGNATAASAPFRVEQDGSVTSSDLTVTGGSIQIGNFTLNTSGNITDDLIMTQTRIQNDSGVTILDTDSDGEKSLLFGGAALREIQAGVANGSFAEPPPSPYANIGGANKLPYWSFTDVNSSGAITAAVVADATAGSGNVLRFSVANGTTAGKSATLTRFIPVASSASQSFSFYAEATCENGSASSQATVQLTCQFYKSDQTTATGTAFTSALYTFNDLASVVGITAPDLYISGPDLADTTAPADAAYLKLTLTVATVAISVATVARTLTTATVNTGTAVHSFVVGQSVTVALSAGPTGYAALNGTWSITGTPTTTSFTFTTGTSGTITVGAATGTASVSIARSVDLTEVRVGNGTPELILTDKSQPSNLPAYIINDQNILSIWNGSQDGHISIGDLSTYMSHFLSLDLYGGEAVNIDAGTVGFYVTSGNEISLNANGAADIYGAPVTITSTAGDLVLQAEGADVVVQDTNVSNGTNPRIFMRDKNGTTYAGIKSGAAGIVQILSGTSTTTYGQLWASRIYPMNGSTASRYFFDDGTRLASSGGFDANGVVYASGAMVSDAISTTTQTASAAIWVNTAGTTYNLRRNSSSARYKTNIVDADTAVLEASRLVHPRHYESTIEDEAGATRLGFIAEEVHDAGLTHAVGYDADGRPESLDTTALIAALWKRVEDLEARLAELETGA